MGVTVLGHFPHYGHVSDQLGGRHLDVSPANWNTLSPTDRWRENRYFLNRTLARRDRIVLAHHPRRARPGSYYDRELRFLKARGVQTAALQDVHIVP